MIILIELPTSFSFTKLIIFPQIGQNDNLKKTELNYLSKLTQSRFVYKAPGVMLLISTRNHYKARITMEPFSLQVMSDCISFLLVFFSSFTQIALSTVLLTKIQTLANEFYLPKMTITPSFE